MPSSPDLGNSLQTRGPIRVNWLGHEESKPNWLQLYFFIFYYLMLKCLSKQRQSRHCIPLSYIEDTCRIWTLQTARFLRWSWETKPIQICIPTHTHRFLALIERCSNIRIQKVYRLGYYRTLYFEIAILWTCDKTTSFLSCNSLIQSHFPARHWL